jgi:hypothetical protein
MYVRIRRVSGSNDRRFLMCSRGTHVGPPLLSSNTFHSIQPARGYKNTVSQSCWVRSHTVGECVEVANDVDGVPAQSVTQMQRCNVHARTSALLSTERCRCAAAGRQAGRLMDAVVFRFRNMFWVLRIEVAPAAWGP